jgi:hypothetical protein
VPGGVRGREVAIADVHANDCAAAVLDCLQHGVYVFRPGELDAVYLLSVFEIVAEDAPDVET